MAESEFSGATGCPPPAVLEPIGKPVTSPPGPPAETWLRSILTDRNGNFDTGRIFVVLGMFALWTLSAYDVIHNGREFKAGELGWGMAALIGALGVYLIGDKQDRRDSRYPPQWRSSSPGRFPPGAQDDRFD